MAPRKNADDTADDSGEEAEAGLVGFEDVGLGESDGEVGGYGDDETDGHGDYKGCPQDGWEDQKANWADEHGEEGFARECTVIKA